MKDNSKKHKNTKCLKNEIIQITIISFSHKKKISIYSLNKIAIISVSPYFKSDLFLIVSLVNI